MHFLVSKVNNNGKEMYNNRVVPLTSLVSIAEKAGNVRLQMVQALLRKDSSMTEQAVMNLKEIDSIINKYEKHNLGKEERKVFESFSADWHILAKGYRKIWR
ncbi:MULTISPECIES: MCP four helix bundle domain-containing protein [unclassified Rummeliibacillus]|uniref:MCP four helix bundle domain-containing protein n=1 Tax=unclassified Rummeliibacillus TaxID=2622809 RepID=UPI002100D96D|nr:MULTISPECIES: MCP four helix bundle domain-containing protein [unclassified Rummeliibacillus]